MHAVFCLVACITKHDALVTSTNVEILLANVNSACNVRALLVDAHQDLAVLVVETLALCAGQVVNIGVEPNLLYNSSDNLVVVDFGASGDLASNHDHVVLGRSLASHLALRIALQARVQDTVRNLIAKLVW